MFQYTFTKAHWKHTPGLKLMKICSEPPLVGRGGSCGRVVATGASYLYCPLVGRERVKQSLSSLSVIGCLDGGVPIFLVELKKCRMSILVAYLFTCPLSILRSTHVPRRFQEMPMIPVIIILKPLSNVAKHDVPWMSNLRKGCVAVSISGVYVILYQ